MTRAGDDRPGPAPVRQVLLLAAAYLALGALGLVLSIPAQEAAGAALISRWLTPAGRRMEREQDAIRFLLLGGVAAGVVSATVSVAGLLAAGVIGRSVAAFTWWTWSVTC